MTTFFSTYAQSRREPSAIPNPAVHTVVHTRILNSKALQVITWHTVALQYTCVPSHATWEALGLKQSLHKVIYQPVTDNNSD